ncbi:MAG: CocE/NonD family hydrolase [Candidatus Binatia bacterium]
MGVHHNGGILADRDVKVPMRDGIALAVDVYRPNRTGRFPALLSVSAYGKDIMGPGVRLTTEVPATVESGHTERLVENGYVHVIGDVRGVGKSEGRYMMWGVAEQADCYDLIEWIAQQPWCDGNVGMMGISYFAMLQVPAAARRPPHLKAILPFEPAGADLYRDWFYPGGILNKFTVAWAPFVVAPDLSPLALDEFGPEEIDEKVRRLRELPEYQEDAEVQAILENPRRNPILFDALVRPEDGAFYRERSSSSYYDQVDLPAYFGSVWGVSLIDLLGAVHGFEGVRSRQKKLIIGPPVFPDRPHWQFHDQILQWYGHWLKGEATGVLEEPPIRLFVMGANTWRGAQTWPLEGTRWTRFYLRADRWLHEYPPIGEDGSTCFEYDPRGHTSVFLQSSVLIEDTEVTGPVAAYFAAACSVDDTAWVVSLYDVFPDGTPYFLSRGWLKASHREVDEERSAPWRPYHPHRNPQPLERGRIERYAIEMMPIANVFKAGHRIGLEIACDDRSLVARGRGWLTSLFPDARQTVGEMVMQRFYCQLTVDQRPKTLAIHHDLENASYLLLPVVDGNVFGTSSWMR